MSSKIDHFQVHESYTGLFKFLEEKEEVHGPAKMCRCHGVREVPRTALGRRYGGMWVPNAPIRERSAEQLVPGNRGASGGLQSWPILSPHLREGAARSGKEFLLVGGKDKTRASSPHLLFTSVILTPKQKSFWKCNRMKTANVLIFFSRTF